VSKEWALHLLGKSRGSASRVSNVFLARISLFYSCLYGCIQVRFQVQVVVVYDLCFYFFTLTDVYFLAFPAAPVVYFTTYFVRTLFNADLD